MEEKECEQAYREQIKVLVGAGVDGLILETFSEVADLRCAARVAREVAPDAPLVTQMAFTPNGKSASGVSPATLVQAMNEAGADVIGANCGGGEAAARYVAAELVRLTDKPVSIFPNRGLADLDNEGNPVYVKGAEYFARQGEEMAALGVNMVGGCCGTTPEDIAQLAQRIGSRAPAPRAFLPRKDRKVKVTANIVQQPKITEIAEDRVSVIAEVDPPRGMNYAPQLEGARKLVEAGG